MNYLGPKVILIGRLSDCPLYLVQLVRIPHDIDRRDRAFADFERRGLHDSFAIDSYYTWHAVDPADPDQALLVKFAENTLKEVRDLVGPLHGMHGGEFHPATVALHDGFGRREQFPEISGVSALRSLEKGVGEPVAVLGVHGRSSTFGSQMITDA